MLFNSLHFLIFFLVVTTIYFAIPHKYRWFLLLTGSCYFYMAFVPIYILILGFTIVVDYFAGILLEKAQGKKKKWLLIASLVANISVLAFFKYYNFLNDSINFFLHGAGYQNPIPYLSIILPIGLSFHTFQAMSYTIEVYRGNQKAERHFGIYSLYVMFYPQLVAGPIERPQNLLHQFYEEHKFDYTKVTDGLKLMVWGLFKKVVIADRLAVVVDNVYDNPEEHTGLGLMIATLFFSFQVFCDFSGYSDIAIGAAQVMGFNLMNNFDKPYHSKNIQEFWKRWHISLSSWFKDYLYIPLGGNRIPDWRRYLNLFIIFLISGLWHGASWTFVIWGALHGFYLVFFMITKSLRSRISEIIGLNKSPFINNFFNISLTFSLVSFAGIFFRANSISDAFYIVNKSISDVFSVLANPFQRLPLDLDLGLSKLDLLIGMLAILVMEIVHVMQYKYKVRAWIRSKPWYVRWTIYYIAALSILLFGISQNNQFIYFQF